MKSKLSILLFVLTLTTPVSGILCQAGCAAAVVACYSGAGAVFGTVTAGVGTAPAVLACNAAFGVCMAACAAGALLAPAP